MVLGIVIVLTIAVLIAPVAKRLRFPYTVLLALVGVGLGFLAQYLGVIESGAEIASGDHQNAGHEAGHDAHHGGGPAWRQVIESIVGLRITSDVILFLFLPALVFESALSLDLRKLMAEMGSILFLAIVGLLISMVIVGLSIASFSGMSIVVCLLLGAIVSATDPVAVIALFKDLNAPKRLTVLVEGESLFNDATAIVVSSILLAMLTSNVAFDVGSSLMQFIIVFLGGIIVGGLIARPAAWLMGAFRRDSLIILTLTVTLPFIAFIVAEHFLHLSGVMAVVACGLTIGSIGRRLVPPQVFEEVEHAWHQLGFWATSLIFILVGLAVPRMLGGDIISYWDDVLLLIGTATLARVAIIYGILPVLSRYGVGQAISLGYQSIMFWGGLRGAVSLALALIVLESDGVSQEARNFIAVMVTSFVMYTLLFQATTINHLMRLFGLDKLSPADENLRDRSLSHALESVRDSIDGFAKFHEVNETQRSDVVARYDDAIEAARRRSDKTGALSIEEWVGVGVSMALAQERQLYLTRFGEGFATTGHLRDALARLDEITDLAAENVSNWDQVSSRTVAFRGSFKTSLSVQRFTGWTGPLARALARRLSVMTFIRQVLREQRRGGIEDIEKLLPETARAPFSALIERRYRTVADSVDALALQYPAYAAALHKRDLTLAGLRLEESAYDHLLEQSVIGPEIHGDLLKRVSDDKGGRLPRLKLKLDPLSLIVKAPYFSGLRRQNQKRIARLLKTKFAVPGETIITRGEVGEEMYFIASGAVKVKLQEADDITLGTDDFFGELALVTSAPRNADVQALGFCTLLALHKKDLHTFLKRHPNSREKIRQIASERLGGAQAIEL